VLAKHAVLEYGPERFAHERHPSRRLGAEVLVDAEAADARSKLRQLDLKMRGGVSPASAAIP
jgi:hypothetical protein